METFFEQLIKIEKTGSVRLKSALAIAGLAILTVIVSAAAVITGIFILIVPAVALFAFLSTKVITSKNIEYEYILTNGILDIDKIVNMSKRKRIVSFECNTIEKIERFNPAAFNYKNKEVYLCCNLTDNAFAVTARPKDKTVTVIIAPNEKLTPAIKKYLQRIILKDAFI